MELKDIKGIGKKRMEALESMGITDVRSLLAAYPYAYQDRSHITKIADAIPGREFYTQAEVTAVSGGSGRFGHGKKYTKISVSDGTENMDLIFFVPLYYFGRVKAGLTCKIYGKLELNGGSRRIVHPDVSFDGDESAEIPILPLYHTARGISQKMMRQYVSEALSSEENTAEFLPGEILEKRKAAGRAFALRNIHFPKSRQAYAAARYRIIYEELFLFQTGIFMLRGYGREEERTSRGIAFPHDSYTGEFAASLGYELTGAQKRVIQEIEDDMESGQQMQRLLQGDVGSGKTAVAAAVLYKAVRDGCQGALMAPTELLAQQHYEKFLNLFTPLGVRVGLLSGAQTQAEKKQTKELIGAGDLDIIVGTQALIQQDVKIPNLGLVVTDEQHRFGVNQRVALSDKGRYPDTLVMTATPIPRSLAVVLFGDMDISSIDELPAGRKHIKTEAVGQGGRAAVYRMAFREVRAGHQVYVVCPLVSDSESVDARSAEGVFEELSRICRKRGISVGLVHGAMKAREKDDAMRSFADGEISILVATVVIEVGIDVPNATVMVIENAERFGLAQLHQLRGRVGRGADQSYCCLITGPDEGPGNERARILASTDDGFEIAEKDLQMRGPGEFFGTRQHGLPELHTADLVKNADILAAVSEDAAELFEDDPELTEPDHLPLKRAVEEMYGDTLMSNIGI